MNEMIERARAVLRGGEVAVQIVAGGGRRTLSGTNGH